MNKTETQILEVLQSIEGSGSFVSSGHTDFVMPGLHIEGFGELPLPLNSDNTKMLIKQAEKASFGKGSQTIKDTNVRSAWEIDASKITFKNKAWNKKITRIITTLKKDLGIEEHKVKASLYKLLIYEKGDFFLSHIDSEKEKGMFGTLVVGLPSEHTGGELLVRFDGREESISFAEASKNYQIPFAAFYADCEHELKPVLKGYRICLTYNLVHTSKKEIGSPEFGKQVVELSKLLKTWAKSPNNLPGVFLLDHQYTPANIAIETLKRHDLPRTQALLMAAGEAGFYASLSLVSHYQMGSLEGVDYHYDRYNRYNNSYDEEDLDGTMGEIYEEYTRIISPDEEGETPSLGEIDIEQDKLISLAELGHGDPIEKEAEGYTGNAGMTLEYWYHYGAVTFWPQNKHADLLLDRPTDIKVNWLGYYLKHWDTLSKDQIKMVEKLLTGISYNPDKVSYPSKVPNDFTAYAGILAKIKKPALFKKCTETLAHAFHKISLNEWTELIDVYQHTLFADIFDAAIRKGKINALIHYFDLLSLLLSETSEQPSKFILSEIDNIPQHLKSAKAYSIKPKYNYRSDEKEAKQKIKSILNKVISFSIYKEKDEKWLSNCLESITGKASRDYINKVLVPLFSKNEEGAFCNAMQQFCIDDLQKRTAKKPKPPATWKRRVPKTDKYNAAVWEMLSDFLQSPTETTFLYAKRQSDRKTVESAIRYATIDLKTETIRRGSPHTLKITKTQAAYEKKLKNYKEDLKLLKKFKVLV